MLKNITQDAVWGFVLITLGIIALAWHPFDKFNGWINEQTEQIITIMLFAVILFYVGIAFFGKAETKAIALAWIVTP